MTHTVVLSDCGCLFTFIPSMSAADAFWSFHGPKCDNQDEFRTLSIVKW